MKDRFNRFMYGRRGMDEFSKVLFWSGLGLYILSILLSLIIAPLAALARLFGFFFVVFSLIRAFSRNLGQRELENQAYLMFLSRKKQKLDAAKERRAQSKQYKFFKCPNCGTYLRVPRGKGKLHINCKCGYILYRKT